MAAVGARVSWTWRVVGVVLLIAGTVGLLGSMVALADVLSGLSGESDRSDKIEILVVWCWWSLPFLASLGVVLGKPWGKYLMLILGASALVVFLVGVVYLGVGAYQHQVHGFDPGLGRLPSDPDSLLVGLEELATGVLICTFSGPLLLLSLFTVPWLLWAPPMRVPVAVGDLGEPRST